MSYSWDFGDGTSVEGQHAVHTYTRPGNYEVTLTAVGLEKSTATARSSISIAGQMPTRFHPETQRRLPVERK
ncbi:Alpha-galactosidase [Acidisarcina polymorpha]|uniref:Alpha-galactosidase n=1 Tax=Acidisarcina polymorpha TaxID=2211140 RepID=A0A2Z5G1W0_9BACT|nr:Alpha-galactosidase [Acidisarcina polymorpha]